MKKLILIILLALLASWLQEQDMKQAQYPPVFATPDETTRIIYLNGEVWTEKEDWEVDILK